MRQQQEVIPVYVVTGFLESGKTKMIRSMITDEDFSRGVHTLIIACEEGIEEYEEAELKSTHSDLCILDSADELTSLKLKSLNTEYKPDRVIIEYNTMWTIELLGKLNLPPAWEFVQVISMADATTFDNYMNNMRKLLTDPMKEADLIMVNRCTPESPKSAWRRMLKGMNKTATILFENLDGTTEDGVADEDLPYDMKAEIIEIPDEHFGTFYLDSLDHPERYDKKTVRVCGYPYPDSSMPQGFYLFGREAMTCCANDIQRVGWVTKGPQKPSARTCLKMTAKCEMMVSPDGSQKVLLLHEGKVEKSNPPKDKYATFN